MEFLYTMTILFTIIATPIYFLIWEPYKVKKYRMKKIMEKIQYEALSYGFFPLVSGLPIPYWTFTDVYFCKKLILIETNEKTIRLPLEKIKGIRNYDNSTVGYYVQHTSSYSDSDGNERLASTSAQQVCVSRLLLVITYQNDEGGLSDIVFETSGNQGYARGLEYLFMEYKTGQQKELDL